ncbi:transcription factor TGA2.2-like [Typha angustifolia]|uniref:transcription factor TGA2.2-like n=1 Tax=Typha angustifolia TaxID=59011 RepID=UPI003C3029F6
MASHRVGETGLSDTELSSQLLAYGINGLTPSPANFFDQEGATYFGELEEALMQGVAGIRSNGERKSFFTLGPPTLEIFPSWPMRCHQAPNGSAEPQPAESTESGSAQITSSQLDSDSAVSIKALSEQPGVEQKQLQGMMMAGHVPRTGAAPNHQPRTQEKKRAAGSTAENEGKTLDAKTLRRLAQNREAARKSRLRKKAYVQQLESSRVRLAQIEQDLQRVRSQDLILGGDSAGGNISSGAAIFDMEYARWLDENHKHMSELQGGLQAHLPDGDLRVIVDEYLTHYDEIFRLKGIAAKSDIFHLITGMWTTPVERCFLWMGGFKPSEFLKIVVPQLDPLTEQQVVGICNLQQSSQQAEEALSQGFEQLHQSLAETVASDSISEGNMNVGNYMGQMAMALGKLSNVEGFVRQADNLRQQTLHQLHRILTVRQAARSFIAIGEYHSRLRVLSYLWASHPRERTVAADDSACGTTTHPQTFYQPVQSHFPAYQRESS